MKNALGPLPLSKVEITDPFWARRRELVAQVVVPAMERTLRDEMPGAEKSHAIENFRIAAGDAKGSFYGMVFQDSDVAKFIEAASYTLIYRPDPALDARLDALIDLIARAQQSDGYLDTFYILGEPKDRWTNLMVCHELYCAGHMIEAAVAHFEATGKRTLLAVAQKLADHIVARFLNTDAVPGHQEIEIGLLRLYRATGGRRYLDMAAHFLDVRGKKPNFFEVEARRRAGEGGKPDAVDEDYNQTFAPVREQREARGHAVRCLYMLTAMADAAQATGDETLAAACERLWENIAQRQMYVTGGIGASARREAFLRDFELPNDTAYAETCASVAMAFFAQRMLCLAPDARYADVLELELYNGALSGMQLDGTRFFYVNPLEVVPGVSGALNGFEHAQPLRQKWLTCACCPPNLARLIASLGRYCYGESDDAVYAHLLIGSRASARHADVELESGLPWRGGAALTVTPHTDAPFALCVRVPGYARDVRVCLNGEVLDAPVERGYLRVERRWAADDRLSLEFDLAPRRVYADPRVRADAGRVALAYGPLVYCLEGVDNPGPLSALRLPREAEIRLGGENAALGVTTLQAAGKRLRAGAALYGGDAPCEEDATLIAIPYYAWSNRGENAMTVWIRE